MARVEENKILKDYEREPVPDHLRRGWLEMGLVWIGVGMCIAAVMLGGLLGAGLPLKQVLIATVAGCLVLTVVSSLCAVVGAKTNLSTAMIAKFSFGNSGAVLIAVLLTLSNYGWFGVQTGIFGQTAKVVIESIFHLTLSNKLLVLIGGLLMTSTAVFGYKSISKLSILAVPSVGILMFASLFMVLKDTSISALAATPPPGPMLSLGMAVSMVAGAFMVGAVITPDISRYARSAADAVFGVILGFFFGFGLVVLIGSVLAQATGVSDIVQIMLNLGWSTGAMLVLILAQWTTNDNNLYSSALSFASVVKSWPKWKLTTVAGIVGTLLALGGIYGQFATFLNLLSVFIPPVGGIIVADYFICFREFYSFKNLELVPAYRPISLATWVLASVFGLAVTPATSGGFGLLTLTTVPAIDSFLAALVFQIVFVWAAGLVTSEAREVVPKM